MKPQAALFSPGVNRRATRPFLNNVALDRGSMKTAFLPVLSRVEGPVLSGVEGRSSPRDCGSQGAPLETLAMLAP